MTWKLPANLTRAERIRERVESQRERERIEGNR